MARCRRTRCCRCSLSLSSWTPSRIKCSSRRSRSWVQSSFSFSWYVLYGLRNALNSVASMKTHIAIDDRRALSSTRWLCHGPTTSATNALWLELASWWWQLFRYHTSRGSLLSALYSVLGPSHFKSLSSNILATFQLLEVQSRALAWCVGARRGWGACPRGDWLASLLSFDTGSHVAVPAGPRDSPGSTQVEWWTEAAHRSWLLRKWDCYSCILSGEHRSRIDWPHLPVAGLHHHRDPLGRFVGQLSLVAFRYPSQHLCLHGAWENRERYDRWRWTRF